MLVALGCRSLPVARVDEMNFELLRVAAAIAGTGAAAWEDHRTSFIDDRITFSMIGLGFLLNLWAWLGEGSWNFFWTATAPALLLLGIGYVFYRFGQLGGGDVLLFAGLQLLLPFYPAVTLAPLQEATGLQLPWLVRDALALNWPFFFSVFVASSVLAMGGSGLQYAALLLKKHRDLRGLRPDLPSLALSLLAVAVPYSLFGTRLSPAQSSFFAAVFLPGIFLVSFKKQLMDEVVVRKIRIEEVEDEDILALDKMDEKLVKKYGLERVLTKDQVARLKKIRKEKKIARFPVCKVLPRYGPYLFAALLLCLLVGDLLFWILVL